METPQNIIEVPGRGFVNLDAEAVNRAVQGEDERLRFGFNPTNQDWMVYIRMPREYDSYYTIDGDPVYPVVGFQDRIPSASEAIERLRAADGRRHGMRILNELNKANDAAKAPMRALQDEAIENTAERIEHELRKKGDTEKYTKVFMGGHNKG